MDFLDNFLPNNFNSVAIEAFNHTYDNCDVYRNFCLSLGVEQKSITRIEEIPFLPIEFFKSHDVYAHPEKPEKTFVSSGTTDIASKSRHLIAKLDLYHHSMVKCFEHSFGKLEDFCFLALLPSYLERDDSSLVYMVDQFMKISKHKSNGFYLHNMEELIQMLRQLSEKGQKTILFGVTFALLDLAETADIEMGNVTIIETGGMKGRRKEMIREELHEHLNSSFSNTTICSEYGMTELLSQAYAKDGSNFQPPAWMKILIRDTTDPLSYVDHGKTGGINVIDLANKYSCPFIATQDLGKSNANGTFQVLGRFDHSDVRGCNLLVL